MTELPKIRQIIVTSPRLWARINPQWQNPKVSSQFRPTQILRPTKSCRPYQKECQESHDDLEKTKNDQDNNWDWDQDRDHWDWRWDRIETFFLIVFIKSATNQFPKDQERNHDLEKKKLRDQESDQVRNWEQDWREISSWYDHDLEKQKLRDHERDHLAPPHGFMFLLIVFMTFSLAKKSAKYQMGKIPWLKLRPWSRPWKRPWPWMRKNNPRKANIIIRRPWFRPRIRLVITPKVLYVSFNRFHNQPSLERDHNQELDTFELFDTGQDWDHERLQYVKNSDTSNGFIFLLIVFITPSDIMWKP